MLEGLKLTAKERKAIDKAWRLLTDCERNETRSVRYMKEECNGYGNRHDRVPQIAAKALCVKWFLDGMLDPQKQLADCYHCRPAAVWFTGWGCRWGSEEHKARMPLYHDAVKAWDAAFERMHKKDVKELNQAIEAKGL